MSRRSKTAVVRKTARMSKTDDGALIDWTTIGRERFERLIEALIPYQHPHGTLVHPVDGRGGDGGIDALAIEPSEDTEGMVVYRDDPGLVVVYQLKYFPDGFSGRNKDRQQQIRRSLRQAIKNVPRMKKWFLVAPCTASNTGWEFLSKLGKENHGLENSFIHRGILDGPKWAHHKPGCS
ncbi:hypothetical protein FB459_0322 [Yimella lutea]|uniref:Restriction endonuclease n=2 Tax=Yimella lutea TaxID=587872 RepID=A0A542EC90_9MICO|nr:hypothetical protein FB459_0322 [Yimella lutea]